MSVAPAGAPHFAVDTDEVLLVGGLAAVVGGLWLFLKSQKPAGSSSGGGGGGGGGTCAQPILDAAHYALCPGSFACPAQTNVCPYCSTGGSCQNCKSAGSWPTGYVRSVDGSVLMHFTPQGKRWVSPGELASLPAGTPIAQLTSADDINCVPTYDPSGLTRP
jgi:hypothetical protein